MLGGYEVSPNGCDRTTIELVPIHYSDSYLLFLNILSIFASSFVSPSRIEYPNLPPDNWYWSRPLIEMKNYNIVTKMLYDVIFDDGITSNVFHIWNLYLSTFEWHQYFEVDVFVSFLWMRNLYFETVAKCHVDWDEHLTQLIWWRSRLENCV